MDGGMLTEEVVAACYWVFMIKRIRPEWGRQRRGAGGGELYLQATHSNDQS